LLAGWNVIGAYTYTDARTTKSEVASQVGQRRNNVPYNQASLWSDYSLAALGLPGVKVGGGARFVGSSVSGIYTLPSYTLFDAMLSYETGHWRAALNGRNLGDKHYYTDCSWQCYWGQGRTVEMTVGYRW
jgi:iron complex outermembrane receptor protein